MISPVKKTNNMIIKEASNHIYKIASSSNEGYWDKEIMQYCNNLICLGYGEIIDKIHNHAKKLLNKTN